MKIRVGILTTLLLLLLAGSASASYEVVSPEGLLGAAAVKVPGRVPLQTSVQRISPNPLDARADKPRSFYEDCMAWGNETSQPPCVYGNPGSKKTVVLFGDSRAQQYFPPLEKIALERNWRLVVLVRGNCFPAMVYGYEEFCDRWKRNMVRRILSQEKPQMVILGSATKRSYTLTRKGKELSREQSQPYLIRGMVRTIRTMKSIGAKVVVLRDQSMAPTPPAPCIAENPDNLGLCAFQPRDRRSRAFEMRAARETGVRIVDPQPLFCSLWTCPAVIGDVVVFLDNYHLTATYAATMKPWLEGQIPNIP